eukprot:6472441-Amphidinium_carterae.1
MTTVIQGKNPGNANRGILAPAQKPQHSKKQSKKNEQKLNKCAFQGFPFPKLAQAPLWHPEGNRR